MLRQALCVSAGSQLRGLFGGCFIYGWRLAIESGQSVRSQSTTSYDLMISSCLPQETESADEKALAKLAADELAREAGEADEKPVCTDHAEALKTMRNRTKNTLHLAALLLQDRNLQVQARMICEAVKFIRSEHLDSLEQMRTQVGSAYFQAKRAAGAWRDVCSDILATTHDLDVLARFQFPDPRLYAMTPTQPSMADPGELKNAQTYMRLVLEVVKQRCWSMSLHSCTLPGMFAGLLHPEADSAARMAEQIRMVWAAVEKAEAAAADSKHPAQDAVKLALDALAYQRHQLVREVACLGKACDWQYGSPDLRACVWRMYATVSNTKTFLEDIFNELRDQERGTKNRKISEWRAYWSAANAKCLAKQQLEHVSLMKGDWDVPLPLTLKSITTAAFTPDSHEPAGVSLGDLNNRDGRKAWKCAGPTANWKSAAATYALAKLANAEEGFESLRDVWAGAGGKLRAPVRLSMRVCACVRATSWRWLRLWPSLPRLACRHGRGGAGCRQTVTFSR